MASSASIGAARIVLGGAVLLGLAARRPARRGQHHRWAVRLGERLTGAALAGLVLVGLAIVILTTGRQPEVGAVSTGPPG